MEIANVFSNSSLLFHFNSTMESFSLPNKPGEIVMKLFKCFFVVLFTTLLSMSVVSKVQAADAAGLKIGVIDFRQIMQQSPQAKAAVDKLKKQFQPRAEIIRSIQQGLEKIEAMLKRDGSVLTQNEQRNLQSEILSSRRDLQRLEEDFRQDFSVAQDQALQEILGKINKAIKDIAQKDQYDLILEKSRIPFASNKLDIKAEVLKSLK